MAVKRSRELKPLSSEHQQALLVAYQLKKGIAGHSESAGAPKDLPGLLALARRYDDAVFRSHTRAEEDLLGRHLSEPDMRRLQSEHREMERLLEFARTARPNELRAALASFATCWSATSGGRSGSCSRPSSSASGPTCSPRWGTSWRSGWSWGCATTPRPSAGRSSRPGGAPGSRPERSTAVRPR